MRFSSIRERFAAGSSALGGIDIGGPPPIGGIGGIPGMPPGGNMPGIGIGGIPPGGGGIHGMRCGGACIGGIPG